jgi:hypothetical protein
MTTKDSRCTHEIKSRIFMEKAAINKKKHSLHQKTGLNLRHKLMKCYVQSIDMKSTENSTFRNADQKYLESFEMWY